MDTLGKSETLVEILRNAIDAENTLATCCGYLFNLIHNGRIRNQFRYFAETAKTHKDLLIERLKKLGVSDFRLQEHCTFCKINAESFSLLGTVNLGLEINEASIKFYKSLVTLSKHPSDVQFFKNLLKEKLQQRNFLKKEKRFASENMELSGSVDYPCISEVFSNLFK